MSLARALLNYPKILLLDEPFSNVDLHSATEMVRLLAGARDRGTTIFVVTHQASLLDGAADEFVWMESGKIVGRTRDLKRQRRRAGTTAENPMSAPTGITRATLLKDLRLEWRSKDAINSMLFFSLLVVVVFSFSFDPTRRRIAPDCRRADLGGVPVRGGGGAEPDLGARAAQPGARRLPGIARSREFAVHREDSWAILFLSACWKR